MGFHRGRSTTTFTRSSRALFIPCAVLLAFVFVIYFPLPGTYNTHRDAVISDIASAAKGHFIDAYPPTKWHPLELADVKSKNAFATFLAGPGEDEGHAANIEGDHYFVATRILAYQLLHAPETRSVDDSVPFIVLVTENVSEEKRARLSKDGAIVVPVDFIRSDWVKTDTSTWRDVMTKLRLWQLTQFDRICFLDGDTVLSNPLDGVFQDPAVITQETGSKPDQFRADEDSFPATYSFAGVPEMERQHRFPPTDENHDFPNHNYLNSGFFVFQPSLEMFKYYLSLMRTVNKFDPQMPEQNLLNYAHRREGNMPWTALDNTLNIHYPNVEDLLGGAKSLHEKWWSPVNEDLKPYMESWRWRMQGYFEARDHLVKA